MTRRENREPQSHRSNMGLNGMVVFQTDELPSIEWIKKMVAHLSRAAYGLVVLPNLGD